MEAVQTASTHVCAPVQTLRVDTFECRLIEVNDLLWSFEARRSGMLAKPFRVAGVIGCR